jgi:hypothetical protein
MIAMLLIMKTVVVCVLDLLVYMFNANCIYTKYHHVLRRCELILLGFLSWLLLLLLLLLLLSFHMLNTTHASQKACLFLALDGSVDIEFGLLVLESDRIQLFFGHQFT